MKKSLLGTVALVILAAPAVAADLPVRGPVYKSPPPVVTYYIYLWTALPLQGDFDLSCLASCKHLSGVTRLDRGAQMGNPLAHASTGGRPQGPR